ncbi:MAG: GPR endopeptidase [Oscillospiraceae bacterium]|nr:GPR endopeptidase [Oscillospiraceae bacterium]
MFEQRTDLALEAKELWQEIARATDLLPGVEAETARCHGFGVDRVRIVNGQGAQALGKPEGNYVTLTLDGLAQREEDAFRRAVWAVADQLAPFVAHLAPKAPVLVACLGNRAITPDAIGPLVHQNTLVTRHLVAQSPEQFGSFRPVSGLSAGVLGTTGVESSDLIASVCKTIHPACVIAVDALAARSIHRVCRTVQLSDTGIVPGSGVGNHRTALNEESLGVPVIAVGVPTVVDGATLAMDLTGSRPTDDSQTMMVTPRDIDARVGDLSKVVGFGINLALQPGLTIEDMELFLS